MPCFYSCWSAKEKEAMYMPGAELAQYGLATFAVAGLLYYIERTDADGT